MPKKSCKENQTGGPPVIDSDLIDRMGPADNIINNYIDQQLADLEAQLPEDPNLVNPGLQQQIDDLKQCRQQCGCEKSTSLVAATPTAVAAAAAPVVGEKKVRRLSWLLVLTILTIGRLVSVISLKTSL